MPHRRIIATEIRENPPPFRKGDRVIHIDHGVGTVTKVKRVADTFAVWLRMDSDGIEGTVAYQLLRKLPSA